MRGPTVWTEFEYCYRDAGNFKAFGSLWLEGVLDADQKADFEAGLESGEFFVAEQVGVPTLYAKLYQWSSGHATDDDHCWHAFVKLRDQATLPLGVIVLGRAGDFADRFARVEQWTEQLSPHFSI